MSKINRGLPNPLKLGSLRTVRVSSKLVSLESLFVKFRVISLESTLLFFEFWLSPTIIPSYRY